MRIVLAYSGGLDTTAAVARYTDEGHEVVAVAADVGQPGMGATTVDEDVPPGEIAARALQAGAVEAEVLDLRRDFTESYLGPALAANARYEGRYPLVSALSRPCISAALVDAARRHHGDAVAHGCTGKGNDQVRFEVSIRALAPDLDVLAPIRDWELSRPVAAALVTAKGIDYDLGRRSPYSIDENMWGRACECGVLEDPWASPPEDAYSWTVTPPVLAPLDVVLGLRDGLPVSLDGETASFAAILARLNEIGGRYGYGRLDMIENRRVGIKSREVYEVPGALALIEAHQALEDLCLDRDVLHEKARLEIRWAELVYDGLWFTPLRESLDAFFASTQAGLHGDVRLRFSPGRCDTVGRRSPVSLYDEGLATYEEADTFAHADAAGFVRLWGLPAAQWAKVRTRAGDAT